MSQEKEVKELIGPSVMTRFERARVLGARSLQISMGAPPIMEVAGGTPLEISTNELNAGVLPMTIRRRLPNGKHLDIPLKWLVKNQPS